jgi:uncharacterized protein
VDFGHQEKADRSGGTPMAFKSISDVINHLTANKQKYHDLYGVTRIGVFGSFVRNEQTPFSDIDMVVEMDQHRKNLHNYLQFKRHMEEALQLSVDVGFEHTLKPVAKESIQRQIVYV